MRKPKLPEDMILDFYYPQFAENGDIPDITFTNNNECYEFSGYCSRGDIKKELKRLKNHAEALLKVHDYLQKVINL